MRKAGVYLIGFAAVLLLSGCAGSRTQIGDIRENPGRFNEQEVTVKGKVVQTFAVPFIKQSLVLIDDGTGEIWVKPAGKVPFQGEEISVKGVIKVGLTFANKNFGFIVIEGEKNKK